MHVVEQTIPWNSSDVHYWFSDTPLQHDYSKS